MYMREAEQGEKQKRMDFPPGYGGQLLHTPEEEQETDREQAPTEQEPDKPALHTQKDFSLKEVFTRLWDKNPLKGFLSYDALLSALAVWLLCNDNEEDDSIFLLLLFLLFK